MGRSDCTGLSPERIQNGCRRLREKDKAQFSCTFLAMFPELRSFSGEPGNLVGTRTMTNSNVMTPVSRRHPVCPNSGTEPFKKSGHVHSRNTSQVSKERSSSVLHSFPSGPTQGQLQGFTHRGGCANFSADALACPAFRKEMPLWGPDFFLSNTSVPHTWTLPSAFPAWVGHSSESFSKSVATKVSMDGIKCFVCWKL